MNAAIRAVVRTGIARGLSVLGVERGYQGMLEDRTVALDARAVGGILRQGGTVLGTARSQAFLAPEGVERGLQMLARHNVDGLVVLGGEGSLHGALALHRRGFPVVGVPGTIDNDLAGTDLAIGVDTALNTAMEAIDRIKDTASAHNRTFVVEVMGRNSGYLALAAGMAAGAEMVLIPEVEVSPEQVIAEMRAAHARGKPHFIVVIAEGARPRAVDLCNYLDKAMGGEEFEVRLTVLGHVQRGGSPTAADRLLASRLGAAAVDELIAGRHGRMVGLSGREIVASELATVLALPHQLDKRLYNLASVLAG